MDIASLFMLAPLGISFFHWALIALGVVVWMTFFREKIGNPFPNSLMKKYSSTPPLLQILWSIRTIILTLVGILIILIFYGTRDTPERITPPDRARVIVLDISKSMETDDLLPSRIEYAKGLLHDTMNSLGHFGFIIFAGKTFVLSPITDDLSGLDYLIETLTTDTINQSEPETSGTNIGDALIQASTLFDDHTKEKHIILITDGRANLGLDPIIAAEALKSQNITISALALGSASGIALTHLVDGKREPLYDGSGNTINGSVDIATLSRITEMTSGSLLHISKSDDTKNLDTIFGNEKLLQTPGKNPKIDEKNITLALIFFSLLHLFVSFIVWHRYKTP